MAKAKGREKKVGVVLIVKMDWLGYSRSQISKSTTERKKKKESQPRTTACTKKGGKSITRIIKCRIAGKGRKTVKQSDRL